MKFPGRVAYGILFLMISFFTAGQALKPFPEEPQAFREKVATVFDMIRMPAIMMECDFVLDSLLGEWDRGAISAGEKFEIIRGSNLLVNKKMITYPDYYRYLYAILELHVRDSRHRSITSWIGDLERDFSIRTLRQSQELLELYENFFKKNELSRTGSQTWSFTGDNFKYHPDTAAAFVFEKANLVCSSARDSSVIYNTKGIYYPTYSQWVGQEGKITWQRVGMHPDSVFAILNTYRLSLRSAEYSIDSVKFYYRKLAIGPVLGMIEEKVMSSSPDKNSSYPRYRSYLKNLEIKNIFKNIFFEGGISVEGTKLIGYGDVETNAVVTIKFGDDKVMVLRSLVFNFEQEEASANPASMFLRMNGDSVYHPGLQMNYDNIRRELTLLRTSRNKFQSPFFDTYHRVDLFSEGLFWQIDSNIIQLGSVLGVRRESSAEFVSRNFFSEYEFDRLQGIDDKNPLVLIRNYSRDYNTTEIQANPLAAYMRKPLEQIQALLINLSIEGFLYYDAVNDRAFIDQKLLDYIDAKGGVRDYDVIRIKSLINDKVNAEIDLLRQTLLIRGIDEIFLSDSQKVFIYPDQRQILMSKNRDFVFSGRIQAGLFTFYADSCSFSYDNFRLEMPVIDSLSFSVKSLKPLPDNSRPLVKVRNVIEDMSGTLQIDAPNNKSGLQSLKVMPVFKSDQESFVYYDHDSIYDRTRFKYHVAPFELGSLDDFSTEGLEFKGFLDSGGIMPYLEEALKVQPDYSLGFITETPGQGYPVYNDKGIFYETIDLSSKGLRGDGTLKYLNLTAESGRFMFYLDSLQSDPVRHLMIAKKSPPLEYPDVEGDSIIQNWYPYQDTMYLTTQGKPFLMFDGNSKMDGTLLFTSRSLLGDGTFIFETSEMASRDFSFGQTSVKADTLDFRLFTRSMDSLAMSARNYKGYLDFKGRMMNFKSNSGKSAMEFPYNGFVSSMDNIDWGMDAGELVLSSNQVGTSVDTLSFEERLDLRLNSSEFVSVNPAQDSLRFYAGSAKYDLEKYLIYAEDVVGIRVADAAIFPDDGKINILKGGEIEPVQSATILADTTNRKHMVRNAKVSISSRAIYEASGLYQYTDANGLIQEIRFGKIAPDSTGVTQGWGLIEQKEDFYLNPYFKFIGNVELNANRDDLRFAGGFDIVQDCYSPVERHWVGMDTRIDPQNVIIPLSSPLKDIDGLPLAASLNISTEFADIYPALFASPLPGDTIITGSSGTIRYDEASTAYILNDSVNNLYGEYLKFDTRKCELEGLGTLNTGIDLEYVDLQTYGKARYLIVPDSTVLNTSILLNFFFDETALDILADSLVKSDLPGLEFSNESYNYTLNKILGKEYANEIIEDVKTYGVLRKLPEELKRTLFLVDVNLRWHPDTRSYMSKGSFGIASVGRKQVNRFVEGYVEIAKRRSGDELNIFIKLSDRVWYYFTYKNYLMQTLSSNMEYNYRIEVIKPEKRMQKNPKFVDPFEYTIASRSRWIEFLERMDNFNQ